MSTKIGKYTIKSELGRGAMGVVYWAEDPRLGRSVALKMMSSTLANDPELLQRFYREAQSAGQLRHPNIVTIYDIDEADGLPFIAMEFLEGESLEKVIASRKEITVIKKLEIIIQACKGLHYAHLHGVVHRDVKPANIMVLEDGTAKIVDFGVARITSASMTSTGSVMGTPMYMSPEQVMGQTVDARSDIFSLGTVLYETLTYENPFQGADITAILHKIINEIPTPLTTLLPNCPPEMEKVVTRALAKNREDRYQTAEDLAFGLQEIASYLKRHMVEIYVQQGQRGLAEGNLTVAKESLQRVLEIDSSHNLAKSLLNKVQEEIRARQRSQRIEQTMRAAKDTLQAEKFDDAISLFDEVLRIDPANDSAQKYKEHATEGRDRQKKIARYMQRAEKYLDDADFQAAQTELDAILTLDPENSAALLLMQSVAKELAERERQKEVRQLADSARARLDEKDYAKALELIEKAAELDPINLEVGALFRQVKGAQEATERQKRLNERLSQIQDALSRDQVEQSVELAAKALEEFPDESRVHKLHTQAVRLVEMQKRHQFIEERLQTARNLLQKNQFSDALDLLEKALQTVPDDARLAAFIKTVEEAQKLASLETLRQEAVQKANEQIRKNNFAAAIDTLERALERVGRSRDLVDLLQFTRDQQGEQTRQERVTQILNRAQPLLRGEDYEEAIRILEAGGKEVQASEIDSLLATARDHWKKFEERREDIRQRAIKLLNAGEPNKAVALMDGSPQAYFKNEVFQKTYAECREGAARASAIRAIVEQAENYLAEDNFVEAEASIGSALRDYPDDKILVAAQKRIAEEQAQFRSSALTKILDDARVHLGRMEYQSALDQLAVVDWKSAGFPLLEKKADALSAEARRKLDEVREREEKAKQEAAARAVKPPTLTDSAAILSAQARLREAMKTGPRHGPENLFPPSQTGGTPASGTDAFATIPLASSPALQEPTKVQPVVKPGISPPSSGEGVATIPVGPPRPKQEPAISPLGRSASKPTPAFAPEPAIEHKTRAPSPVASLAGAKRSPVALWVGAALVILVLAGFGIWRLTSGGRGASGVPASGFVELTAASSAEIVSIQSADGKTVDKTGETPLLLELPAGDYVIELKNGTEVQKANVSVHAGDTTRQNVVFPKEKIDEMVNDLVTNY